MITQQQVELLLAQEYEKCKDPVYFYENYFLVNGQKPEPLFEWKKQWLRAMCDSEKFKKKE